MSREGKKEKKKSAKTIDGMSNIYIYKIIPLGVVYLVRSFLSRPKHAIRGTGILGRI